MGDIAHTLATCATAGEAAAQLGVSMGELGVALLSVSDADVTGMVSAARELRGGGTSP
ncbi:MAG: hypothetical protein NVSMB4_02700 [Acidimicrobiales bacterium]